MIVKTLDEVLNTDNETKDDNWSSRRFLLNQDNVGFTLTETVLYAGTETYIWYKNHVEAVYCVEGSGEVETLKDGQIYAIKPGTMYCLDGHEKHYLRAHTDLRVVCVFNPPLTGKEVHDEDGVYPLMHE